MLTAKMADPILFDDIGMDMAIETFAGEICLATGICVRADRCRELVSYVAPYTMQPSVFLAKTLLVCDNLQLLVGTTLSTMARRFFLHFIC